MIILQTKIGRMGEKNNVTAWTNFFFLINPKYKTYSTK